MLSFLEELPMHTFTAHCLNGLLAVTAAALLAACATTAPTIHRDTNPAANFASYRTFAFFSPLATDKAGYETVFTGRLKASTRRAMESKGYVYNETSPDLLLNFYANVQDKQEIRSTPSTMGAGVGYYGYRGGMYGGWGGVDVETINYKQGTLAIDVIDAAKKMLVWQATAEGRVSAEARKNPGPAIDAAVTEMMSALPTAATM
jgi:hypothetical protein